MNINMKAFKKFTIKYSIIVGISYMSHKYLYSYVKESKFKNNLISDKNTSDLIVTTTLVTFSLPLQLKFAEYISNYIVNKKKKDGGMIQKFGVLGFTIYMSYWVITGIIVYLLVKNKFINKEKLESKINDSPFKNYYQSLKNKLGDKGSDFVLAYFINAILEIIRLPTFLLFMKKFMK